MNENVHMMGGGGKNYHRKSEASNNSFFQEAIGHSCDREKLFLLFFGESIFVELPVLFRFQNMQNLEH